MKLLYVQLQPALSPHLDVEAVVARLHSLAVPSMVERGEDVGPYINVSYATADLPALWAAVWKQVRSDEALAQCAIVCCQGEHGWDDYQLLHPLDSTLHWTRPGNAQVT